MFDKSHRYYELVNLLIAKRKQKNSSLVVAINGCQGSGKSTLAAFLENKIAQESSYNIKKVSLDDFYLDQQARNKLAQNIHPLLSTRGVPGTHDTHLLKQVLFNVKADKSDYYLPIFDKATDNPLPKSNWHYIHSKIDILIIEGWCLGTPAQNKESLVKPINELESSKDEQALWRTYVNNQLLKNYHPLYQYFDFLIYLKAPSFEQVLNWRWQQEQELARRVHIAQEPISTPLQLMTKNQIGKFIQYFERITCHGFNTLEKMSDVTYKLDNYRNVIEPI